MLVRCIVTFEHQGRTFSVWTAPDGRLQVDEGDEPMAYLDLPEHGYFKRNPGLREVVLDRVRTASLTQGQGT